MTQVQLTEVTIRNLPLPEKGQRTYLDNSLKGFGVRVSQGGSKTFTLMFGKDRQLNTIGRFGVISLAQARQQAREILAEQTLDIAPEKKAISYKDAVEQFLAAYRAKNKSATANETERLIRRHLIFDKAVSNITTADITKRIDQLSDTPSEQQHAFVAARHLFRWYERRRLIPLSPLAGVEAPHRPIPRDRVLDGEELASVYRARDDLYGDIV